MKAPEEALAKFSSISDPKRRLYAAVAWKMDGAIGHVTQTLWELDLAKITLVFVLSDNGGALARGVARNGARVAGGVGRLEQTQHSDHQGQGYQKECIRRRKKIRYSPVKSTFCIETVRKSPMQSF